MILKIAEDGFERLKKGPVGEVLKGFQEKRPLLMFEDDISLTWLMIPQIKIVEDAWRWF